MLSAKLQRVSPVARTPRSRLRGIGVLVIVAGIIFVHRHEAQLIAQAERAMPGPLRLR